MSRYVIVQDPKSKEFIFALEIARYGSRLDAEEAYLDAKANEQEQAELDSLMDGGTL